MFQFGLLLPPLKIKFYLRYQLKCTTNEQVFSRCSLFNPLKWNSRCLFVRLVGVKLLQSDMDNNPADARVAPVQIIIITIFHLLFFLPIFRCEPLSVCSFTANNYNLYSVIKSEPFIEESYLHQNSVSQHKHVFCTLNTER